MAQLVDQYNRPVSSARLKQEQARPTLTGVRSLLSGHPAQGLTPARLAALLREAEDGDATRYLELAEEMEEKDLHYLSVLGTRKRQIAQLEITVEPGDESARAQEHADFLEAFIDRDELQDELVDILDAVGKGFSATEILWETSARQWWPARLEWRLPQWFAFSAEDGWRLLLRGEGGQLEELAPFKFIVHQAKVKSGLPIRGGLARAAAWGYLFKNYDLKDWVAFVEVYGQPLRVGKYHPGATEDEKEVLLRAVADIGSDAAAIVPDTMLLEFIDAPNKGATATDLYERLAHYIDGQVSKAVLGQTLTTEVGDSGSRALGDVHNEVRQDIETSDAKQLGATLNRDLARPMIDLNFGPQPVYPRFRIGRPEQVNVPELSDALAKLVPLGLEVRQSEVRRKLDLEEPEEGDELLGTAGLGMDGLARPAAMADPQTMPMPSAQNPAMAQARRPAAAAAQATDAVDRIVDKVAKEAAGELAGLTDRIKAAVEAADDFADLAERLKVIAARMNILGLSDLIAQGLILAQLAGRDDILSEAQQGSGRQASGIR